MTINYKEKAINILAVAQGAKYQHTGWINIEEDFNNIQGKDDFDFTWTDVQTKATELETADTNEATSKATLKASAKAKLIAGEPLTEDEANTIVL